MLTRRAVNDGGEDRSSAPKRPQAYDKFATARHWFPWKNKIVSVVFIRDRGCALLRPVIVNRRALWTFSCTSLVRYSPNVNLTSFCGS